MKKITKTNIVKLYPYILPDIDITFRKQKIQISQLSDNEKKSYKFIVNGLEGEVSKHSQYFKTMSFALKGSNCFALVTHLNAGTLELCRKMSGIDKSILGEVFVNGIDITTDQRKKNLSVSIQSDLIPSKMSGFEYLEILCYCRGVKSNQIIQIICEIFDMFNMKSVMLLPLYTYNQCQIKKLSLATAFIGQVDVIVIDQPTVIIDPEAKTCIWNAIRFARSLGKTIIFTTDSISEAEFIADTMLLLVEGSTTGLTSPIALRAAACKGFYFEFRISVEGTTQTEVTEKYVCIFCFHYNALITKFCRSLNAKLSLINQFFGYLSSTSKELKSMTNGSFLFYVPMEKLDWVKILKLIEQNRERLGIRDYILDSRSHRDLMYK